MKILFLTHNTPYPPNKGEKIRAYHFLKSFAKNHEVDLFSLVKDVRDLKYEDDLKKICSLVRLFPMNPLFSKLKSLVCIPSPFPMTFGYYYSFWMHREIKKAVSSKKYDLVFAYCSSMGQYLLLFDNPFKIIDFVDIDSIKWKEYAAYESFPMSFIYSLENIRLKKWEKILSSRTKLNLVTTSSEKEKLGQINFKALSTTHVVRIGIEENKFSLVRERTEFKKIIFVGQMDYLPNIDAVIYFYLNILPIIRSEIPETKFEIVGRNPDPRLQEICMTADITGEVESVAPYLAESSLFVAPLRLAFGVQTKVLEAMAAGIPVVATSRILSGLKAKDGRDILTSNEPQEFAEKCIELMKSPEKSTRIATNAQAYLREFHDWENILTDLDKAIERISLSENVKD